MTLPIFALMLAAIILRLGAPWLALGLASVVMVVVATREVTCVGADLDRGRRLDLKRTTTDKDGVESLGRGPQLKYA